MVRVFEIDGPPQQVFHHSGIKKIVEKLPLPFHGHQVRPLQEVQVVENAGLGHVEFLRDLAGGQRSVAKQFSCLS